MHSAKISLEQYCEICTETDVSPCYHPRFIEFYFAQLKKKPKIIGRFDNQGRLLAAYPVLFGQIFPNSLHKKLLKQKSIMLGEISQPEALFPVVQSVPKISLNCFSPTTSPILSGVVRGLGNYSLKSMAIAKKTKHKNPTRARKSLFKKGAKVYFTDELDKNDFADIYIRLHGQRWGYSSHDLRYVRVQILKLYNHIYGGVLFKDNEPLAAHLCFKCEGRRFFYVDAVNIGVKSVDDKRASYGSIMILSSLRKAEEISHTLGKTLRFSFGYYYGPQDYKNLWAYPEKTFIAF